MGCYGYGCYLVESVTVGYQCVLRTTIGKVFSNNYLYILTRVTPECKQLLCKGEQSTNVVNSPLAIR